MSNSKKNKNFTKIAIGLIVTTFVFYLFTAKPSENFAWNKNIETTVIQEMNRMNESLNAKATILPEKFIPIETNIKGIYTYVENMPKFINCEYMLEAEGFICTKKYILNYAKKIEFPKGKNIEKEYAVFVRFIVNKKGYVKNVEILNEEPNDLNKIVKAHIKKMPKFAKPGFQDNKPVKVQYVIPVTLKPN